MTLTPEFGLAPEVAVDKLCGFDTAADLAGFLAGQGIQGCSRSARFCPIALWLTHNAPLPQGQRWVVTGDTIAVEQWWNAAHDRDYVRRFDTSEAAAFTFVEQFDNGGFPELYREDPQPACDCWRCKPE